MALLANQLCDFMYTIGMTGVINILERGFVELEDGDINQILMSFGNSYRVEECDIVPNKVSPLFSLTLSSVYGLGAYPFHTDGAHRIIPPQWIILQYLGDENCETATLLFDSQVLSEKIENEQLLFNEIYLVSKGPHAFLTPLINKQLLQQPIFRWNKLVMKKMVNKTNSTIDEYIEKPHYSIRWRKGKIVIIDNWRVLHSREEIIVGEENTRKLKRFNLTPIKNYARI